MLVVFVIFQLLDSLTTLIGLKNGGKELNPLYVRLGAKKFYAVKLGYLACATAYFLLMPAPAWILSAAVLGSVAFVMWNMSQLIKMAHDREKNQKIRA